MTTGRLRAVHALLAAALLFITVGGPVSADRGTTSRLGRALELPDGPVKPRRDPRLARAQGQISVWVELDDPPLVVAPGQVDRSGGVHLSAQAQRQHVEKLVQAQDAVVQQAGRLNGRELGRVTKALNAVAVRIDARRLPALAALPGVRSVRPVVNQRKALRTTVPYIGATTVRQEGFDGTGVTAAVLDSGIDYTHKNLGGPGTLAAYQAAYGTDPDDPKNTTRDGLFPTAKVIGGFDFVGEVWDGTDDDDLAPDPDPIDHDGHGTHVADIIAGNDGDGHRGVAPGARLLAVKVCSAVSVFCSEIAELEGIDFALDPNGDDDLSDGADIFNLSLGFAYGQREDVLAEALANVVRGGRVVVAAAGNDGDRPYILSSPASAPEVIAVAETQVPTAKAFTVQINSPAGVVDGNRITNTTYQPWSAPLDSNITANLDRPSGDPEGCDDHDFDHFPAGRVALVDRGDCNVSIKVSNAAAAGAAALLLVDNTDSAVPPALGFGGGSPTIPALALTAADGGALVDARQDHQVNVTLLASGATPLVGGMVSSSARGPSYSDNSIKPDLGAPGGSVSAEVGTGSGQTAFGGTSGATPMVAGAAALLRQAFPNRSPLELKSLLVNTAETRIFTNPAGDPVEPAPITRIGGGEVRVDRAVASGAAAWDNATQVPNLSFGYQVVTDSTTLTRTVRIQNFGDRVRNFSIGSSFRFANDRQRGAVDLQVPNRVRVPARGSRTFKAKLKIDPRHLPEWTLNGGPDGGDGPLLQDLELDGYVTIQAGDDSIHLPWQVLPHRAAAVEARLAGTARDGSRQIALNNDGAADGAVDIFALTGHSPRQPDSARPAPGDNFALIDLQSVGVRQVDDLLQFAVTTYDPRSHPSYPAQLEVDIDTDRDGEADYYVFNAELTDFAATGQDAVFIEDVAHSSLAAFYFVDADLDSANIILTVPLDEVGLTPGKKFDFQVFAFDNYFSGYQTDQTDTMTFTSGTPRFQTSPAPFDTVRAGHNDNLQVSPGPGESNASPSQTGLLLLYRDARPGHESAEIKLGP